MKFTQSYLDDAQAVIVGTVRKFRPELLKNYGSAEYTLKPDHTVVTHLDKSIELALRTALQAFDSSVGITGEEGAATGDEKTCWVLDPIDGTEQFIRGLPGCATFASLLVDDKPTMAILYDFVNDAVYRAILGKGATCDGQPLRVSDRPLERSWLEISHAEQLIESGAFQKLTTMLTVVRLRNPLMYICQGKMEGYAVIKGKGGPWDYIPRSLLVSEAGGRVENLFSTKYDYRDTTFLATSPQIFEAVKQVLEMKP